MQKGIAQLHLLIILLIIGGLGGYYYFTKSSNPAPVQPTPTVTQKPADASSVPNGTGETDSWKTYTNNIFNFSFKHPSDLSYSAYGSDFGNAGYILFKREEKEYFVLNLSDNFVPTNVGNFMGSKPLSKRLIGGKEWDYYNFYYQDKQVKDLNYNVIAFETVNNNFLYSFVFNKQTELISEQDQILSTFKFN